MLGPESVMFDYVLDPNCTHVQGFVPYLVFLALTNISNFGKLEGEIILGESTPKSLRRLVPHCMRSVEFLP
jgi:hypothetical protein